MIDAVADEMDERVGKLVDDGLVELGLFAFHNEAYVLAKLGGQVTHQALELGKGRPDGQHPDPHGNIAELGAEPFHLLCNAYEVRVALCRRELGKPCLNRHQLAHQVHQGIEPWRRYADA